MTTPMRRLLLLIGALGLGGALVVAQSPSTFEAISVTNTAVALSAATLSSNGTQMNYCTGRVQTAQIRYRDDGTAPTSSVGTVLEVGDVWQAWSNQTASATRFIRTGSTSGVIAVSCYPTRPQ